MTNPVKKRIRKYIASPKYAPNITEPITKIGRNTLFDILKYPQIRLNAIIKPEI